MAVGGFTFSYRKSSGESTPLCGLALVGKSTTIRANCVLVETNPGGGAAVCCRQLNSNDTISTSNGILGVSMFDITTDANGKVIASSSPVSVDTRGKLDTTLPITNVLPTDPQSGYIQIPVMLFDPQNVFAALTATNELANFYDVNRSMGITASAATDPIGYTIEINPTSTAAALMCEGVDTEHPQFNSANGGGRLFVSCKPTFFSRNITGGWFSP